MSTLAALHIRPSTFDPVGALREATALQQARTQQEMTGLRMQEMQEEMRENRLRRGALEQFRAGGGMATPGALNALSAHPELYTAAQSAMTARDAANVQRNARGARTVLSLMDEDGRWLSEDGPRIWRDELESARAEGRIPATLYAQYASMGSPPRQLLENLVRMGQPPLNELEQAQAEHFRAQARTREGELDNRRVLAGLPPLPPQGRGPVGRPAMPPASGAPEVNPRDPRSVRLNNPGAMEYGPFARSMGATGSDGRFAIFPTLDAGYGAMERLLENYGRQGRNTVSSIIERWAPRNADGNHTDSYIAHVARSVGIRPNEPIPAGMMPRVAEAMAEFEAGRPVPRGGAGVTPPAAVPGGAPAPAAAMPSGVAVGGDVPAAGLPMPSFSTPQLATPTARPVVPGAPADPSRPGPVAPLHDRINRLLAQGTDDQRTRYQALSLAGKFDDAAKILNEIEERAGAMTNIVGGLNELARIPNRYGGDSGVFGSAVGPFQGPEPGIMSNPLGYVARTWGSLANSLSDVPPSEVRRAIAGATTTLSSILKPLIRKPGEGTWTDADQARLDAIIGDLAQSGDARQYQRELDNVRQRIMANFNVVLPVIDPSDPSVQALQDARDAIRQGANREAVMQRLRTNGIDPARL